MAGAEARAEPADAAPVSRPTGLPPLGPVWQWFDLRRGRHAWHIDCPLCWGNGGRAPLEPSWLPGEAWPHHHLAGPCYPSGHGVLAIARELQRRMAIVGVRVDLSWLLPAPDLLGVAELRAAVAGDREASRLWLGAGPPRDPLRRAAALVDRLAGLGLDAAVSMLGGWWLLPDGLSEWHLCEALDGR